MINRRCFLSSALLSSGSTLLLSCDSKSKPKFRYCLNTATINGKNLTLADELEIVAHAGYDGIEIWVNSLQKFIENVASTKLISRMIDDLGIKVENAIGFAKWIVNDDFERNKALEHLKREMDLLAQIGCTRIAAPPAGVKKGEKINLDIVTERYQTILDLGGEFGVDPQLELWGFSTTLSKLGEAAYVLMQTNHPNAALILDAYHLYKGGNNFDALKYFAKNAFNVFHINDYPSSPSREKINDSQRIMPGDGIAPLGQILRNIYSNEKQIVLSLELFNRDLWEQEPLEVAKFGLEKMKLCVEQAFEN